ncbi:MAG: phosphate ABC transporter permease subunit PstC [Mycobacterium sp.]|nr:phosphate ABC transporter permease subunit PstC [Mycobacterium sp.]
MTITDDAASPPLKEVSLAASSPRYGEKAIKAAFAICAALSVAITTAIVLALLFPTISFFSHVSIIEFFTGTSWRPAFATPSFGVLPIVVGTLTIVFWALLIGIPVGLLSAIYLAEYAPTKVRKVVKPILEILEGIPTVAIGMFGLLFMRPFLEDLMPFLKWEAFSVGVAGIMVGIMIVPLITSVSDDAMRSVPAGLREGAYGLGSNKMQVSLRVIFPGAISGIIAAVVLATSRAIGETMVVLIVAGQTPLLGFTFTGSVQTMTAFIGSTATGDISTGSIVYEAIFAVGALLFVMTLAMNMFAIRMVSRFREVYD